MSQDLDHISHMDLAQKSRVRWGVEGDENSGYFHGVINRKRRQLAIKGVMVEGQWVVEPSRVKEAFHSYYTHLFAKQNGVRPVTSSEMFSTLTADQSQLLQAPFLP